MSERSTTYLKKLATGEPEEAYLIDGITVREIEKVESIWKPYIDAGKERLTRDNIPLEKWPQHLHWDWRRKHKRTSRLLAFRWLGIECDNEMQGLMVLDTATTSGRLREHGGQPLVYIHYLATAPWNSAELVETPKYGWVGRIFMAAAIQISEAEGFKGRLGLHALPQSESYYSDICGMSDLGKDASRENLKYFEMTAEQATRFLK